jgi:hypothetical protein
MQFRYYVKSFYIVFLGNSDKGKKRSVYMFGTDTIFSQIFLIHGWLDLNPWPWRADGMCPITFKLDISEKREGSFPNANSKSYLSRVVYQ